MRGPKIIVGSSHPELCHLILDRLALGPVQVTRQTKPNHEKHIDITTSVRNEDVFIVQSGSDNVNDHFMELLILVNACKLASAKRITAVLPYFPYSKQSKKKRARAPITAKCKHIFIFL
jgi:ribose-phosphate pyrophosphokinase